MDPSPSGSGSAPPAVTPDSWAQLTAYVKQLGEETKLLQAELAAAQAQLVISRESGKPKPNKPSVYAGKLGEVDAWVSHMDSYLAGVAPAQALSIATTYLHGEAFSWWSSYKLSNTVTDWETLRAALVRRFNPLNKKQAARNLIHKWRQVKDVTTFNKSFQTIVMDIPDMTTAEKIDRYSRGLKSYIWESLCTKTYDDLESLMLDALKVEAAKRGHQRITEPSNSVVSASTRSDRVPMDISNIPVSKLTPEERKRCMRDGLCLRCRQKGHMAKDCPKGQRN